MSKGASELVQVSASQRESVSVFVYHIYVQWFITFSRMNILFALHTQRTNPETEQYIIIIKSY